MSVVEALLELGGVATRAALVSRTSRTAVDRALMAGDVAALARGRYALPGADEAIKAAHRLSGVVSHESAALHWGWPVRLAPEKPHILVPKNRKRVVADSDGVVLHRGTLLDDDRVDLVTSKERTLVDCLRSLEFDAALSVADSALREGFDHNRLAASVRDLRGPGSAQARRVAREATDRAANPFESVLRAICLDVPGLRVNAQRPLYGTEFLGKPDLVDEDLRIVIEADSFEWHGDKAALGEDCRRYNMFVCNGWLVLRFCWDDVMFAQDWVHFVLRLVVAERANGVCWRCRAA